MICTLKTMSGCYTIVFFFWFHLELFPLWRVIAVFYTSWKYFTPMQHFDFQYCQFDRSRFESLNQQCSAHVPKPKSYSTSVKIKMKRDLQDCSWRLEVARTQSKIDCSSFSRLRCHLPDFINSIWYFLSFSTIRSRFINVILQSFGLTSRVVARESCKSRNGPRRRTKHQHEREGEDKKEQGADAKAKDRRR